MSKVKLTSLIYTIFIIFEYIKFTKAISFRYNNNNDYNFANYNSFEPKFLSQSVHFKEIPTKTIQITKTVAIKVPVPYPVKVIIYLFIYFYFF